MAVGYHLDFYSYSSGKADKIMKIYEDAMQDKSDRCD